MEYKVISWDDVSLALFLNDFGLGVEQTDLTVVAIEKDEIVGTISTKGNVIKMFAVSKESSVDTLAQDLILIAEKKLNMEYDSNFVYTKIDNESIFKVYGYKPIAKYEDVCLLEKGAKTIEDFIKSIAKYNFDGAIVMNANPFTLGHKFLVETASKRCKSLAVFVVENDLSSFDFKTRLDLVKKGCEEFENVVVLGTKNYMVSMATFPSYFLKDHTHIEKIQMGLDASLFGTWFSIAGIDKRFVGTEPLDRTTKNYNDMLRLVLPEHNIELIEVERLVGQWGLVSATKVRKLIADGNIELTHDFLPPTTYNFLVSSKAKDIIERIQKNEDSRH